MKLSALSRNYEVLLKYGAVVALLAERSAPDRSARIGGSLGETPPCTPVASDTCKISRGCNVLQVPLQIIPLGMPKGRCHPLRGGSKF